MLDPQLWTWCFPIHAVAWNPGGTASPNILQLIVWLCFLPPNGAVRGVVPTLEEGIFLHRMGICCKVSCTRLRLGFCN